MHSQPPASEPRWLGGGGLASALAAGGGGDADAQSCCGSSTGVLRLSLPYRSYLGQVLNHPTLKPLFSSVDRTRAVTFSTLASQRQIRPIWPRSSLKYSLEAA